MFDARPIVNCVEREKVGNDTTLQAAPYSTVQYSTVQCTEREKVGNNTTLQAGP